MGVAGSAVSIALRAKLGSPACPAGGSREAAVARRGRLEGVEICVESMVIWPFGLIHPNLLRKEKTRVNACGTNSHKTRVTEPPVAA